MVDVSIYTDRITGYHRNKPRYMATVAQTLAPFVDALNLLIEFTGYFDLDPNFLRSGFSPGFAGGFGAPPPYGQLIAIGAQLDILGEWINLSRRVNVPVPDPWLRLDDETRGLDEGRFREPYSFDDHLETIDDETYRRLLKARIFANQWDGTSEGAYKTLVTYFSDNRERVVVDDHPTAFCVYGLSGHIPNRVDCELWGGDYLPLRTSGFENYRLITSVEGAAIFGLDVDNEYIGGLDAGAVGVTPQIILNDEL